ncbi:hypothetical protein K492DRAFT_175874 [Lichtheimia hyalospora FSU 10163]|nr:hypothetical protein K492DRAFT_175874 [Lichtheimia hyalospora FSU 10163]
MVGVQVSEPTYQCFDIRWQHKDTTTTTDAMGGYNGFRIQHEQQALIFNVLLTWYQW